MNMNKSFYEQLLNGIQQTSHYHFEKKSTHYFEAWTHYFYLDISSIPFNEQHQHVSMPKSFAVLSLEAFKWCTNDTDVITFDTLLQKGCAMNIAKELFIQLQKNDAHKQYVAFSKLIAVFSIQQLQDLFQSLYVCKYSSVCAKHTNHEDTQMDTITPQTPLTPPNTPPHLHLDIQVKQKTTRKTMFNHVQKWYGVMKSKLKPKQKQWY